jgi:hypothetical protein
MWCHVPGYRNVKYKLHGVTSLNVVIFSIILITFVQYTILEWSAMEDKLGDVSVGLSSCYCFLLKDVNCENSVTRVIEEWMCTQHSWTDTKKVGGGGWRRRFWKRTYPVVLRAPPITRGHAALVRTTLSFISLSRAGQQHFAWQGDRDGRSGSQEIPRCTKLENSLSLDSFLGYLNAHSVFSFAALRLMLFILLQWNTVSKGDDVQDLNMLGMSWFLIEWTQHTRDRETWRK